MALFLSCLAELVIEPFTVGLDSHPLTTLPNHVITVFPNYKYCDSCNGTGLVESQVEFESLSKHHNLFYIKKNGKLYDSVCIDNDKGTKDIVNGNIWIDCSKCRGFRYLKI